MQLFRPSVLSAILLEGGTTSSDFCLEKGAVRRGTTFVHVVFTAYSEITPRPPHECSVLEYSKTRNIEDARKIANVTTLHDPPGIYFNSMQFAF